MFVLASEFLSLVMAPGMMLIMPIVGVSPVSHSILTSVSVLWLKGQLLLVLLLIIVLLVLHILQSIDLKMFNIMDNLKSIRL